MSEMKRQLSLVIREKFGTEAECARALGWPKQRLNKLVNAIKEPDLTEVAEIALAVGKSVSEVADIFLLYWSPFRQLPA